MGSSNIDTGVISHARRRSKDFVTSSTGLRSPKSICVEGYLLKNGLRVGLGAKRGERERGGKGGGGEKHKRGKKKVPFSPILLHFRHLLRRLGYERSATTLKVGLLTPTPVQRMLV